VAVALYYKVVAGPETIIVEVMTKKSKSGNVQKQKLIQVVELLKFVLTLDDEEIVKSTVESIIELLEEEIDK